MPYRQEPNISFYFLVKAPFLKDRKRLKNYIKEIFRNEGAELNQLTYVFCSDEELRKMNKEWLDHDFYTDILTFNFSPTSSLIIGEAYISIDRVKENAKSLKINVKNEINRVIFHGALHLCGYNDKNEKDILEMRRKEDQYLSAY